MNFKLLSLASLIALVSPVFAIDAREVVTHVDSTTWCTDVNWAGVCTSAVPSEAVVTSTYCEPGDMGGKNPLNTSSVICGFGNPNVAGQLSLITGYVMSLTGATPIDGGLPNDTC